MLFALETLLKAAPECAGPMTHEYVKRMESRPAYVKVCALMYRRVMLRKC